MNKREMRRVMKDLLKRIAPTDLAERSAQIAARLAGTRAWDGADTVLCFLSMAHEVVTAPILEAARAQGRRIAVPRIEGDDIVFRVMPSGAGALPQDRLGIPEPDPAWPALDLSTAGRVLVAAPGLAFDRQGNRLGRGKGYYDRFLARARAQKADVVVVGVSFSQQLVPAVPHSDADQPLDGVATDAETVPADL
jgi:5-formyltetrahydrofolate cyclo-ligase